MHGEDHIFMSSRPTKRRARNIFATNLRKARLEKGLSQEALAELAGIHRTYVGCVERAEKNISIDSMEKLGRAIGRKLNELLDEES